ncbi:hypothetical protein C1894_08065 [Pseudomonas sp. FW305-3-2-15-E-TSA2]|nr:hypothetical protein C1895_26335 [Pseudomonas sp. FW305-3-2-15-E-TSA4]POA43255.1 hypothetical protein C1894_08065 [Pseudomonas sp. FW305-3-2-15-E-TSA2]
MEQGQERPVTPTHFPVGASLLANASGQSTSPLNDTPPSRASRAPTGFRVQSRSFISAFL